MVDRGYPRRINFLLWNVRYVSSPLLVRIGAVPLVPTGNLGWCVVKQPEPRSPLAVGLDLASRITTIGLEFALPAAAGYGLDSWLGTMPVATVAGVVLGFLIGMLHAVRMSGDLPGGPGPRAGK